MKIKKAAKPKHNKIQKAKKIETPSVKVAKKELEKAQKRLATAKQRLRVARKIKEAGG